MEKFIKSDRKYNKEEQLFINPKSLKNFSNRKNKNKSIKIFSILIIIILLIILLTRLSVFLLFKKKDNFKNKAVKAIKEPDFYKYQSMMPHLSPDPNDKPSSLESILNPII